MIDLKPSSIPRVPSPLLHERKDSLHLLLHPEKPLWAVVNDLGFEIANLCDGQRTVQDIATAIASRYDEEPATIHADVVEYLGQLQRAKLLSSGDGADPAGGQQPALRVLQLNVTENCNLRCVHCAVTDGSTRPDVLTTSRIYRLLDEFSASGGQLVAISGGEPLLRQDCLDILRYAAHRVETALSTNGTLIDERVAEALSELEISIQISLDGARPSVHDQVRGEGAFARTMRGIDLLLEHGLGDRLTLCATIMRSNVADIPSLIELAEAKGVAAIRFLPLQRLGRARCSWAGISITPGEYIQLGHYFYREIPQSPPEVAVSAAFHGFVFSLPRGDMRCEIGDVLAVDATGSAYPCCLLMRPDFCLGNVAQSSLRQIVTSPRVKELRERCASIGAKLKNGPCGDCPWRNFCISPQTCSASVFLREGSIWDSDELCRFRRGLYQELIFDSLAKSLATGSRCGL